MERRHVFQGHRGAVTVSSLTDCGHFTSPSLHSFPAAPWNYSHSFCCYCKVVRIVLASKKWNQLTVVSFKICNFMITTVSPFLPCRLSKLCVHHSLADYVIGHPDCATFPSYKVIKYDSLNAMHCVSVPCIAPSANFACIPVIAFLFILQGLAFRIGTHQLFSCSADRSVKVWNLDEMAYVETLWAPCSSSLSLSFIVVPLLLNEIESLTGKDTIPVECFGVAMKFF